MNAKHFMLGALLVAAPVAFAQEERPTGGQAQKKASRADEDVLKKLHQVNREEIELGQLAQQQASSDEVKQFGKMMVEDHRMADEKITQMADQHGVMLGDDSEAMKKAEKLGKKTGNEFDREYLSKMVKGHEKVISMVTSKQKDVSPELQTMLTEMLPTLRQHHMQAKELLDKVKGGYAAGRRSTEPQR